MSYRLRKRVENILDHQESDRVPYCAIHIPFSDDPTDEIIELVDSLDISEDQRTMCLEGDFAGVRIEPEPNIDIFRPFFDDIPKETIISYWGYGSFPLRTNEGYAAGNKMYHPLANLNTIDELKEFPFPDISHSGADSGLEEEVSNLKKKEYIVLGQMSQTILETAYRLRGIPQLMIDFYERPIYVDLLFTKIMEQRLFQAKRMAEAGVDILRLGDDIATQTSLLVSPKLYRERIKLFHAAVIKSARDINPEIRIKYHSDGALTPLLPDLIDIGVNIINPVQPECMDLTEIKKNYGEELVLWGCMPVQSLFENGSRKDIIDYIDFIMREIALGGGVVIKFINFLATKKSKENLGIFLDILYEKGKY